MNKNNENELDNLNNRTDSNKKDSSVELGDYSQLLTEKNEPTVPDESETVGFEDEEVHHDSVSKNWENIGFGTDEEPEENKTITNQYNQNDLNLTPSRSMNNKKRNKKKIYIFLFIVLFILGGFIFLKKPFVKETTTVTSVSLNSTEEKQVIDVVKTIASFYEDGGQRTILKQNIDIKKVEALKKAIDGTSNKVAKEEFLRLYEELEQDIDAQKVDNTSSY